MAPYWLLEKEALLCVRISELYILPLICHIITMLLILLSSPVAAFPQLFAFPKLQREPTSTPYTAIFPANNSLQQILDINFIALDMAARIGKVDPSLKFSAFTKAAYDANGLKIAWNNFQLVRAGHPYVAPTSTDIRGPWLVLIQQPHAQHPCKPRFHQPQRVQHH